MKSKWFFLLVISLVVSLAFGTAALAQPLAQAETCSDISLVDGWARATAPGAPNGAVFGLLVNLGAQEDRLIGASTDAAETVEVHETIMGAGDVMQMQPVEGGLAVAPNGFVTLQPGGYHIMLFNLKAALEAGKTLDLTLHFAGAGDVSVTVPIREMTAMDSGSMDMSGGASDGMSDMSASPTEESMGGMSGGASGGAGGMGGMNDMTMADMTAGWSPACQGVHVVGGWVRATVPGMPNSAAYGLILNLTGSDVTLVGATTPAAGAVEVHEMTMAAGDVMQMRPVEGGLVIPAGGSALLQPGGLHLMMFSLTGGLDAGSTADITLQFADGTEMPLTLPIVQPAAN